LISPATSDALSPALPPPPSRHHHVHAARRQRDYFAASAASLSAPADYFHFTSLFADARAPLLPLLLTPPMPPLPIAPPPHYC